MAVFVMVCQGRAHDGWGPVGQYLESFDPEPFAGRGVIRWTANLDKAQRFPGVDAVMEEWRRSPKSHPIRLSDGLPNRPLTGFTISIERID